MALLCSGLAAILGETAAKLKILSVFVVPLYGVSKQSAAHRIHVFAVKARDNSAVCVCVCVCEERCINGLKCTST